MVISLFNSFFPHNLTLSFAHNINQSIGHGGMYVVDYISVRLPAIIKQKFSDASKSSEVFVGDMLELSPEKLEEILVEAFLQADNDLMNNEVKPNFEGGTTATVAIVTTSHIIVANIGDSPSLTFSKLDTQRIINQTENHNPSNPNESKRIIANGGKISSECDGSLRVDGFLSITRAFGHRKYKSNKTPHEQIISALPQTYIWKRTPDMMIALCTDSFTEAICTKPKLMIRNILGNQDILLTISKNMSECDLDLNRTVNTLCDKQIEKFNFPGQGYAGDNTSIILIDFSIASSSSSLSEKCNDSCDSYDSTVTDQSSSPDRIFSSSVYDRCMAEGGFPSKELSGIKRTSNCMSEKSSHDTTSSEEESRPRSFSRSDGNVSSSRTTPTNTPNRSRNSSFVSDFASSVNVNAEPLPKSSSWADVASNPQSPVGETVFMNGLSLSPPDNSSPSLLGTLGHSIVKVNSTATTTFTAAMTPQSAASVM